VSPLGLFLGWSGELPPFDQLVANPAHDVENRIPQLLPGRCDREAHRAARRRLVAFPKEVLQCEVDIYVSGDDVVGECLRSGRTLPKLGELGIMPTKVRSTCKQPGLYFGPMGRLL
jgi:hypothetical protein